MKQNSSTVHLVAAAHDDPAAFAIIYKRYVKRVYRYLYHQVSNFHDAEDLTAQVFMVAGEALPNYQERGLFTAWLFSIARNKSREFHRNQRVEIKIDHTHERSGDNPDPIAQLVSDETLSNLKRLITNLSQEQQELLNLRFAAGLNYRQIGAVVSKSEAAVKMQLKRLLDHLRAEWND